MIFLLLKRTYILYRTLSSELLFFLLNFEKFKLLINDKCRHTSVKIVSPMPVTRTIANLRICLEKIQGITRSNSLTPNSPTSTSTSRSSSSDSTLFSPLKKLFNNNCDSDTESEYSSTYSTITMSVDGDGPGGPGFENPPPDTRKIKLPIYNPGSTDNWFLLVDRVLQRHNIQDELSKTLEVLSVLPIETQDHVASLIAENPDDVYEQLKKKIIEYNRPSYRERMRDIISTIPMGDRKPTDYLLYLRKKFGVPQGTTELLEYTFKDGLGESMTMALATMGIADIDVYAAKADELFDLKRNKPSTNINQLNNDSVNSTVALAQANATLTQRVLQLEKSLAAVKLDNCTNVSSISQHGYQQNSNPSGYNYPQTCNNSRQLETPPTWQQRENHHSFKQQYNKQQYDPNYNKQGYENNKQQYQRYGQSSTNQHYSNNHHSADRRNMPSSNRMTQPNHYSSQQDQRDSSPVGPRSWCRFHRLYGASARRCTQPCNHPSARYFSSAGHRQGN